MSAQAIVVPQTVFTGVLTVLLESGYDWFPDPSEAAAEHFTLILTVLGDSDYQKHIVKLTF